MTQTIATKHLTAASIALGASGAIEQITHDLPDYVKAALLEKSTEMECSLEAVVEMAIASFLDEEAFSFEDCLLAQRLGQP
jgi:hypothetical protein